jgi:hypothetical protein
VYLFWKLEFTSLPPDFVEKMTILQIAGKGGPHMHRFKCCSFDVLTQRKIHSNVAYLGGTNFCLNSLLSSPCFT